MLAFGSKCEFIAFFDGISIDLLTASITKNQSIQNIYNGFTNHY